MKCWTCGKYGHKKSECSFNKKNDAGNDACNDGDEEKVALCSFIAEENENLSNKTETDVVLLNNEYDLTNIAKDVWIGDTGVSCHMINNLYGITDLSDST